jgi:ferric-dicitrate binding protein FerR (iron transport regulator)
MDSELLCRFFEGLTTEAENLAIKEWSEASPQNRVQLLRERKLFDAVILLHEEPADISYSSAEDEESVKKERRPLFGAFMKVAAVIAILLMSGLLYTQIKSGNQHFGTQTINVPAGQYVNLSLPDGTQIWLNSRTKIEYPVSFNKEERLVKLDGQAYFEVEHNEKSPFIVETSKGKISVLGTKFDVMAYSGDDKFETTLMDGSVKVDLTSDPKQSTLLKPNTKASLNDGRLVVENIPDYDIYRWKEGLICFNNASFGEIMNDFERIYGMRIIVENVNVNKYTYTGKFRFVDGIEYALRVLQRSIKFGYERNTDKQIIHIK